jgi:hypothetical protein
MVTLSISDIDELDALARANKALNGPSFIMRHHWRESGYHRLVRQGLVIWGDPPEGFTKKRFAGTQITAFGAFCLASALAALPA